MYYSSLRQPPSFVIVTQFAVIFFMQFSEKPVGSWANGMLKALDYNKHPEKVQEIIRQVYKHATEEIKEVRSMWTMAFLSMISDPNHRWMV